MTEDKLARVRRVMDDQVDAAWYAVWGRERPPCEHDFETVDGRMLICRSCGLGREGKPVIDAEFEVIDDCAKEEEHERRMDLAEWRREQGDE